MLRSIVQVRQTNDEIAKAAFDYWQGSGHNARDSCGLRVFGSEVRKHYH